MPEGSSLYLSRLVKHELVVIVAVWNDSPDYIEEEYTGIAMILDACSCCMNEVMASEKGLLADALSRENQHCCMSAAFVLL